MRYNNTTNIPLSIAAWLADDTYDYDPDSNVISATGLMKPIRAILLSRTMQIQQENDLSDFIASKVGSSVHDGIEDTWRNRAGPALKKMGYPESVWNNIIINPEPADRNQPGKIDVFVEVRGKKPLNSFIISGKFDFVAEGQLEDFKNKKVWAWIFGSDDTDFIIQGSIYRWLHPDIITEDTIAINYIFTDWNRIKAATEKDYPSSQIKQKKFPLMSMAETERWITDRTNQIKQFLGKPQAEMPECSKSELWQRDSVWKYYKDPNKRTRSTKNFDNPLAANSHCAKLGVGIVIEVPGEVKRCHYCSAAPACLQREELELNGMLKPL